MPLDFATMPVKPKIGDKVQFSHSQCDQLLPEGTYIGTVTGSSYILGRNAMGTEWLTVMLLNQTDGTLPGHVNVRYKVSENVEYATSEESGFG